MNETLRSLLLDPRIWQGEIATAPPGVPTGCDELDAALPGGGWPRTGLIEILLERHGIGELELLMPALARLSREERLIAWVAPPFIPYAPALSMAGFDLEHLLIVHAADLHDRLWSAEQAMRSGSCSAVLLWAEPANSWLRRLQLAAEVGTAWGVLFRTSLARNRSSHAILRLRVQAGRLELLKCRGARPRVLKTSWRSQ